MTSCRLPIDDGFATDSELLLVTVARTEPHCVKEVNTLLGFVLNPGCAF
jgi:hypothetical protein